LILLKVRLVRAFPFHPACRKVTLAVEVAGANLKKSVIVYLFVTVHGTLKLEVRASFKHDLRFVDVAFRLVPILQRKNSYGMHSHAGARERETFKL